MLFSYQLPVTLLVLVYFCFITSPLLKPVDSARSNRKICRVPEVPNGYFTLFSKITKAAQPLRFSNRLIGGQTIYVHCMDGFEINNETLSHAVCSDSDGGWRPPMDGFVECLPMLTTTTPIVTTTVTTMIELPTKLPCRVPAIANGYATNVKSPGAKPVAPGTLVDLDDFQLFVWCNENFVLVSLFGMIDRIVCHQDGGTFRPPVDTFSCLSLKQENELQIAGYKLAQATAAGYVSEMQHLLSTYNSTQLVSIRIYNRSPTLFPGCWWPVNNGTCLHLAAACNQTAEVIQTLIDAGSSVDVVESYFGYRPLHYASRLGNRDLVERLLPDYVTINGSCLNVDAKTAKDGSTSLILGAISGSLRVVTYLLDCGASIDSRNSEGYTALMYAASYGMVDMCALLLDRGADIEATALNGEGFTALMIAAVNNKPETVEFLLGRGAQVNAKSRGTSGRDMTVLALAKSLNRTEIVNKLLYSWGAKL